MKLPDSTKLLRIACGFAVIGLALMIWSLVDPTQRPVLIALSVGQCIGTGSLAIFLFVVIRDYRLQNKSAKSE